MLPIFRLHFRAAAASPYLRVHGSQRWWRQPNIAVISRRLSTAVEEPEAPPKKVAIFWDYENCALPSGKDGPSIVHALSHYAKSHGNVTTFRAYLDRMAASTEQRAMLRRCGVTICDCPHDGDKDVADKAMIVDMFQWALGQPAPSTIILISGDKDFAYAVSTLSLHQYTMIVVAPKFAHDTLRVVQTAALLPWADAFLPELAPKIVPKASQIRVATSNLPSSEELSEWPSTFRVVAASEEEQVTNTHAKSGESDLGKSEPTMVRPEGLADIAEMLAEPEPEPPEYARVFQPLVETLRSRLQQGSEYILYTQLASQLASEVPWIYKEIGHSSFKKYVLLAHEAEIIQYEDENKLLPKRMIGLHPRLR